MKTKPTLKYYLSTILKLILGSLFTSSIWFLSICPLLNLSTDEAKSWGGLAILIITFSILGFILWTVICVVDSEEK